MASALRNAGVVEAEQVFHSNRSGKVDVVVGGVTHVNLQVRTARGDEKYVQISDGRKVYFNANDITSYAVGQAISSLGY